MQWTNGRSRWQVYVINHQRVLVNKKQNKTKQKAKKMLKDLLEAIYTGKIKDVNFSSWKYNIEGGAVEQIPLVNNVVGSDYMFC